MPVFFRTFGYLLNLGSREREYGEREYREREYREREYREREYRERSIRYLTPVSISKF